MKLNNIFNKKVSIPSIDYHEHPQYREILRAQDLLVNELFFRNYNQVLDLIYKGERLRYRNYNNFKSSKQSKKVDREGFCELNINQSDIDQINSKYEMTVDKIKHQKSKITPEERAVTQCIDILCTKKSVDSHYHFFSKFCHKYNILETVQAHKKMPMTLKFVALQINDYTDKGIEESCRDSNGKLSQTKYMHIDSGIDTMKVIVYLNNNISNGKGSFSYVKNSHNHDSMTQLACRKASDISNIESLANNDQKRLFISLPKVFQYKANFGNDLTDEFNSKEIEVLTSSEHYVESRNANAVIFNPDGIHRGGFFNEPSERRILQLMFVPSYK